MIYLILSIACSTSIYVIFKSFDRFKVALFPAIVANYLVASTFGLSQVEKIESRLIIPSDWWFPAIIISLLFISLFYLMARTAQTMGVSVSSNASKMSMLIPLLLLAIFYPNEKLSVLQGLGIAFAFVGIYLTSLKKDKGQSKGNLFWPFLLFVGSGILDFILAYANEHLLNSSNDDALFTSLSFALAFAWGVLIMLFLRVKKNAKIPLKSILGGLFLGLVNYGSIFFLLRTYAGNIAQKTAILPINNMGVIVFSTLLSILFFQEKLSKQNILGLAFSLLAILIIFVNS